jgi:hypothetical protein
VLAAPIKNIWQLHEFDLSHWMAGSIFIKIGFRR